MIAENAPGVLADAAYALACFGEDIIAMIVSVDRPLAFNPNYAMRLAHHVVFRKARTFSRVILAR